MSIADKLETLTPDLKPGINAYVAELSERDRAALIAAANDRAWSTAALHRLVREDGCGVGKDAFGAWRDRVSR